MNSSEFVWINCAVLEPFQICRNDEFLYRDCFSYGEINIFVVDIQSELAWSRIDVFGDDADGPYLDLRKEWYDDECLSVTLGSYEIFLLEPSLIFSEQALPIFRMFFVKASYLISINCP